MITVNTKPANKVSAIAEFPQGFSTCGEFYSEAGNVYRKEGEVWRAIELYLPCATGTYKEPLTATMHRFFKDAAAGLRGTRYSTEKKAYHYFFQNHQLMYNAKPMPVSLQGR